MVLQEIKYVSGVKNQDQKGGAVSINGCPKTISEVKKMAGELSGRFVICGIFAGIFLSSLLMAIVISTVAVIPRSAPGFFSFITPYSLAVSLLVVSFVAGLISCVGAKRLMDKIDRN